MLTDEQKVIGGRFLRQDLNNSGFYGCHMTFLFEDDQDGLFFELRRSMDVLGTIRVWFDGANWHRDEIQRLSNTPDLIEREARRLTGRVNHRPHFIAAYGSEYLVEWFIEGERYLFTTPLFEYSQITHSWQLKGLNWE